MQFGRRANSTARAKSLVNKTKDAFGSFIKTFKSLDIIPSSPSSFKRLRASANEGDDEDLPYPSPPFARAYPTASQRSGSTGSTAVASITSRYTYRTNKTATEDNWLDDVIVRKPAPESLVNQEDEATFSTDPESEEDYPSQESDHEDGEDDEVLLIRSKRGRSGGFATSLRHHPYAAFLSQPSYKQPYVFPRRS